MANVKFNEKTYYVPTDKFLIGVKENTSVQNNYSKDSKVTSVVKQGQVFSVSSEVNNMFRIKPGWVNKEACEVLKEATNEIKDLAESFVVKVINNIPIYTEASINSHTATILRVGDLECVVGESEDFYKLAHGGYIEKKGCRRY